jgi:hypothetical protein
MYKYIRIGVLVAFAGSLGLNVFQAYTLSIKDEMIQRIFYVYNNQE